MSINLLDLVKDQVTGSLAKQASSFLGESENNVTSALDSVFPALLGSVIDKAGTPKGASGIMDMIGGLDSNMLGNIGNLFGGGASSVNGLLNSGGGIVEALLGNKMGGVIDLITKVSGLKSGSSSSLLKMAAPFLMSFIGKQIAGKGVSGLTDLLMGQKSHVSKAMPSGMGNILGLANLADGLGDGLKKVGDTVVDGAGAVVGGAKDVAGAAASTVADAGKDVGKAATQAANSGMGFLKWLLPLVLIGAAAWFLMGKGCGAAKDAGTAIVDTAKDAGTAVVETTKDVADATGDAVAGAASWTVDGLKNIFGKVDAAAKAALDKLTFQTGTLGDQLRGFIDGGFKGDAVFRFKDLKYATGSANIDAKTAQEISDMAAILKAYPGLKVNVEGYTDNQGDAAKNVELSKARAGAVKARLMAAGISADRLNAVGFGSANPIASNDTAEGRAQNRRTEIRIVK